MHTTAENVVRAPLPEGYLLELCQLYKRTIGHESTLNNTEELITLPEIFPWPGSYLQGALCAPKATANHSHTVRRAHPT